MVTFPRVLRSFSTTLCMVAFLSSGADGSFLLGSNHPNQANYESLPVLQSENGELRVTLTIGEALFTDETTNMTTKVVGYNGMLGGPTLVVQPGDTLYITLINELPPELCDTDGIPELWNQFHGADTTNLHVHGLHVPEEENPNTLRIESSSSHDYVIHVPPSHQGGTHWYHPHSAGSSAMHVGGGAAGLLIVDDIAGDLPPEVADLPQVLLQIQHMDFWELQNSVVNGTQGRSYIEACQEHCLPVEARSECSESLLLEWSPRRRIRRRWWNLGRQWQSNAND